MQLHTTQRNVTIYVLPTSSKATLDTLVPTSEFKKKTRDIRVFILYKHLYTIQYYN